MPKTFPIMLEVEEIALGTVLRKLNDMPGIAKLHLDLDRGGEGAGRKELEGAATQQRGNNAQTIVKLLMEGPKSTKELFVAMGGKKSSLYTATSKLKKDGVVQSANGQWQLTHKASAQLGAVKALPAPTKVSHGPKGRATPGSGNIVLRAILGDGAVPPGDVRKRMGDHGMSPKSVTGVLDRAKRAGLIKKNGNGYELTAKGQKIEMGAQT